MDNNVMFKIGYGLYVLTCEEDGKDNGCIINTTVQVTSNPNRISVTVNKQNYTTYMCLRKKKFNISILSEKADFEIFKHFGFSSGGKVDKFRDFEDFKRAENGISYITKGTNAYISCKVYETIDLGSHIMFIADVTGGEILSDDKSVTYDYYHANIKPKPEKSENKTGYRCKICGYVYEGENLPSDFICPLCKHGAEDFEKI
jgi:flavin reductase (DIM6/NTAB) family NADH-FMN oxidoreductase RutF